MAAALSKGPSTPPKGAQTPRKQLSIKSEDLDMPPVGSEAFAELQQGLEAPLISPDPPCPYLEAPFDPVMASPCGSLKRKATALECEPGRGLVSQGSQGMEPDTPGVPSQPCMWCSRHGF